MEPVRIVLVDDHTLFREGTRELLARDPDLEVVAEAGDGLTAVDLVDDLAPDVAIVDIEMPGIDGLETTRRIKERRPETAVLVLTVHDEEPLVLAILEAGAAGYLLKDVRSSELIHAVKALHAGESVLHPTVTRQILDHVRRPAHGRADAAAHAGDLTADELAVLAAAADGRTNQAIADDLGVSVRTVQLRLTHTFEKLSATSRTEAVAIALRRGLLPTASP